MHGDASMFTKLLEILDEAVTIRDRDGDIVYANRAAVTHMGFDSLDEMLRRSSQSIMDDYIVEDEHGHTLTHDDVPSVRIIRDRAAGPLLMRVVHRSTGDLRWNLLKATPLHDEQGEFQGVMTVIEDVTAVKTAEVRTRVLAESGVLLASSLDYQQTLRNIAGVVVPALADWCAIDLIDSNNRREHVVAWHRDPAKVELAQRLREFEPPELDPGQALARVMGSGNSELYSEVTDEQLVEGARDQEHLRLLRELGMRSVVIVPMHVPARTIGVLTLVTAESRRRLGNEDAELAEQLGRRAAVAVENARLHTTLARVAETLQQSLLPNELPDVPGWELSSLYRPAGIDQRIDVGGDFYEVFENGGTWFAVIGDVTGKGVTAASLTALMRHSARAASRLEPQPAAILRRLDEALREAAGDSLCTAMCLALRDDQVVLSSAGHPPAMLVNADATISELPSPGPLLGAFEDAEWPEESVSVTHDQLLLLYTDGVIETSGRQERFGGVRLRALLAENAGAAPAALLERLDAALESFRTGPGRDDVAVLAMRPRPRD